MNFLEPVFFWSFLSVIPLAAIYFLKVRPTRKPTTAYFLWQTLLREKRATSLFNRLRDLWSLLIMLLVLSAVVLAMTRPEWSDDERKDLLLLIDRSASMSAAEGGKTRLERAKEIAVDIVSALDGNQRAAVAAVDFELSYRAHFTRDPHELLEAIEGIEPSELAFRSEALNSVVTARDLTLGEEPETSVGDHRVLLLSDGCFMSSDERMATRRGPSKNGAGANHRDGGRASETENSPDADSENGVTESGTSETRGRVHDRHGLGALASIELLKIGGRQGNIGIARCDLQVLPGQRDSLGFYFQIASSFEQEVEADLTLSHVDAADGSESAVKVIPLTLQPGLNKSETYNVTSASLGRWTARLKAATHDHLALDDVAFLHVPAPRPVRVAVRTKNPYFFERTILSFEAASALVTLVGDDPELVVATGSAPDAPLSLVFSPSGSSIWWEDAGDDEVETVVPRVVAEDHPALRHFDVSTLSFAGARRLSAPAGALVLVESDQGMPLIFKVNRGGKTAIVVNMDPARGDFFFSAWFPVLVYSAATHLGGREETIAATYPTGATAPLPGSQEGSLTTIRAPNGAQTTVATKVFGPLRYSGFYDIVGKSGEWRVASSLLAASESLLDNSDVRDTALPIHRGNSLPTLLTVFAILLLVLESLLYHRRKVG